MLIRHVITGVVLLLAASGCRPSSATQPAKTPPPAKVEGAVKETDLVRVKLSPEAERRLGIATAAVEHQLVPRVQALPGEVIVPHGQDLQVTAPFAGTVLTAEAAAFPRPGDGVKKGQVLFRLSPVLATGREVLPPGERLALVKAQADLAAARVEAEGSVATAEVRFETAKINLERADQLKRQNAGSQQAYDLAQAELRMAEASLKAARARLEVLQKTDLESKPDSAAALALKSPQDGVVRAVNAAPGQEVAAGSALFAVIAVDPIWIRVPVYVGDLGRLDLPKAAEMRRLSDGPGAKPVVLRPVPADPSADPLAVTADLYFETANTHQALRPGERVLVILPLRESAESLVVPWSAVVYDFHGTSWIYENPEPTVYVRRRVELRAAVGGQAVLVRGPAPGTRVVSAGTAELFGTEFGVGK